MAPAKAGASLFNCTVAHLFLESLAHEPHYIGQSFQRIELDFRVTVTPRALARTAEALRGYTLGVEASFSTS